MSRIVPQILCLSQHLISFAKEPWLFRPDRCPSCGMAGSLWGHGSYDRKANRARVSGPPGFIPIPRFYCKQCKRTCSRLPECLPPRRWYLWTIQQQLLVYLLSGLSLKQASARIGIGRSTGRRWWRWLKRRADLFGFYLKDRFPDLGRSEDFFSFWLRYFKGGALSAAMVILTQSGVSVP